jgi:menaquinone-9 beta-reductase
VREVAAAADGARLRLSDGSELRAGEVLIATGKQDLGGRRRSTRWAGRNRMLGLKMHLGLEPPARRRLGDTIEMHLFPGGCAGLQPIESGANLCITLSQRAYDAAGRSFETLLRQIGEANPSFRAALSDSWPLRPRPLAIARVPYGFLRAPGDDGLWHVGDQIAVTSSLTGAGLAIALDSGTAAAEALLAGAATEAYRASFVARARRQIAPAMALQAIVDRPRLHRPSVLAASALPRSLGWLAAVTRLPQAGDGRHPPPSGLGNRPGAGSLAPAAEQGAAR